MLNQNVGSFLTQMFEDRQKFIQIHGARSVMDPKFMLVSDAMSEHIELLTEIIKEQFQIENNYLNKNSYSQDTAVI